MERLTRRLINGKVDCAYCTGMRTPDNKGCSQECELLNKQINKLAAYEEKQDKGLVFEFPCKPGDTLYRVATDENREVESYTVDNIVICQNGDILFKYDAYDGVICHLENIVEDILYLDTFRVFLTIEQVREFLQIEN